MVNVKAVSILLAVLAAVVLGHGIADVLYTVLVICSNTSSAGLSICPLGENLAILFTWIGASVWCSIFVFITAVFGLRYAADPVGQGKVFTTLVFLSAVFFLPVMIICCALEVYWVITAIPGATASLSLWDSNSPEHPGGPYVIKFVIPLAATVAGLLEFFIAAGLLIYACVRTPKEDDVTMMTKEPREPRMKPRGPLRPRPVSPPSRPVTPRPGPMNSPGFGYQYYNPRTAYPMPAARPYGYPYGSYYY